MTSVTSNSRRDRVVNVVSHVIGLNGIADRSRLLDLIAVDRDVEESVAKMEDLCTGSLGSYTTDELKAAGMLRLGGVATDGSLTMTNVESWGKCMRLAFKEEDFEEPLRALIDHNIECGKITTAFKAQASRYLGSNEIFSKTSMVRHNVLKHKVARYRDECAIAEKKLQAREGLFAANLNVLAIHGAIVEMAYNHPDSNTHIREKLKDDRERLDHTEIFREIVRPHDHILTKLQMLSLEVKYNDEGDNALVADARRYASEVVRSYFRQCRKCLDLVFLEASQVASVDVDTPTHANAILEERRAIAYEIDSLWEEVVPVAYMAVENQFLKPYLRTTRDNKREAKRRNAVISAYISGVLRYMNQRLQVLAERFYILVLHHQAVFDAYRFALPLTKGPSSQYPTSSMQDLMKCDAPTSCITLLQEYLAKFGSVPIDIKDDPAGQPAKQAVTKLQEFVMSRNGKLSAMYEQMQDLFEAAAKANLGNVKIGRAILSRRIVADGSSGLDVPQVVHRDEEAEEAIRLMEDEVEVVRERFRRLGYSGAADAPNFVLQAYLNIQRRLKAKHLEGCLNSQTLHVTCPTCNACTKFCDFVERWGDA